MKEYKKYGYADMVWNPFTGCSKGCPYCWARPYAHRLKAMGVPAYQMDDPFAPTFHPERLSEPSRWRKSQVVACNFMGDMFDPGYDILNLDQMFNVFAEQYQHTFLVLTKRPDLALKYYKKMFKGFSLYGRPQRMPANVWWGTSITSQDDADKRIPDLLTIPGKKWLSIEPCLGPITLPIAMCERCNGLIYEDGLSCPICKQPCMGKKFDQVIIGAQSGPNPTIMQLYWARDIVEQCRDAGVPLFVKQLHINNKLSKDPAEWPEDLRVRQLAWDNNNAVGE